MLTMFQKNKMRTIIAITVTFLFSTCSFLPLIDFNCKITASATLDGKNGDNEIENYAVFLGLAKYEQYYYDAGYADVNAISIYEFLKNEPNWKEENMRIFLNEEVTKKNMLESIRWLAEKSDENDVVLFYYSGHGIPMEDDFQHSQISDYYMNLSNDIEMEEEFSKVKSNHIVMIFDCCWSARLTSLMKPGRVMLSAGGKYFSCVADWDENLERGFLTYYVCQGLKGPADREGNKDGIVSAEEAYYYARKRVTIHSFILHMKLLLYPLEWGRFRVTFPWVQVIWLSDKYLGDIPLVYL